MGVYIPNMEKPKDAKQIWIDVWSKESLVSNVILEEDEVQELDLVRCGECKYSGESLLYPIEMVCKYHLGHTYYTEADRFCFWGKRREDERDDSEIRR